MIYFSLLISCLLSILSSALQCPPLRFSNVLHTLPPHYPLIFISFPRVKEPIVPCCLKSRMYPHLHLVCHTHVPAAPAATALLSSSNFLAGPPSLNPSISPRHPFTLAVHFLPCHQLERLISVEGTARPRCFIQVNPPSLLCFIGKDGMRRNKRLQAFKNLPLVECEVMFRFFVVSVLLLFCYVFLLESRGV